MGHVLVVAPDSDLRRSMQFALETEGHSVIARPDITDDRPLAGAFDCTVLDHQAARGADEIMVAFCVQFYPVILLVSKADHALSPRVFDTLQKPLLGPALVLAVRRAVALGDSPK